MEKWQILLGASLCRLTSSPWCSLMWPSSDSFFLYVLSQWTHEYLQPRWATTFEEASFIFEFKSSRLDTSSTLPFWWCVSSRFESLWHGCKCNSCNSFWMLQRIFFFFPNLPSVHNGFANDSPVFFFWWIFPHKFHTQIGRISPSISVPIRHCQRIRFCFELFQS